MAFRLTVLALGALCCLFAGCGCSKERPPAAPEGVPPRMKDAAYTNQLVQLHDTQRQIAAQAAAIRAQIEKLGPEAGKKPEYAALTNRLAECAAALAKVRQDALGTVRARILKESGQKGNLKK